MSFLGDIDKLARFVERATGKKVRNKNPEDFVDIGRGIYVPRKSTQGKTPLQQLMHAKRVRDELERLERLVHEEDE